VCTLACTWVPVGVYYYSTSTSASVHLAAAARARRMLVESQSLTGPLQVFLSQLHQRAMFLNAAFQDRVREVIAGHSDQVRQPSLHGWALP
jgi:hypothetical protein